MTLRPTKGEPKGEPKGEKYCLAIAQVAKIIYK
jgi:hypothetical protein